LHHIAEPADVRATRARANLIGGSARGAGSRPFGLDVTIDAPNAVFVRGRGLNAELGGSVHLGGTTTDVIAQGGFSLIRGRLDILGNRLTLTEGNASLRGSLEPTIRLVAETQADDVAVRITLDGLASDPSVTFSSSPSLPEDEILSRLIFGRGLDAISPFQALRLASAVATLSGRGGAGTIGRLRDGFGLDDLDVTTGENGALEISAGTYISENIYTDVTVGAEGKAEINLNLTLTPSITAKGSVASDGNSSVGIFFEKDY
jgi:translocation and assembly module TamB